MPHNRQCDLPLQVELPAEPATYVLVLRLKRPADITIGKLGRFSFPAGWYAYVGSGRGPGGLSARISRHLQDAKALHWHIDYLRVHARPVALWYRLGEENRECRWAQALSATGGAKAPAPRFGASDCRCPAHLYHFAAPPDRAAFSREAGIRILMETFDD
jgi:Uri superfamily endonuclease